ncbi:microcystin dependent MdpB family protein [Puia dinghuensis]|uniref:Microcystin dependent MdpB family protein n=2 Tax=Puia dinghuensis TaxID=1792502 RepID=A0A8J2UIX7_9BACT|nr:microcystin dependent MdpB family protein [Puia dinghuensis]
MFACNFAPNGWSTCNGQVIQVRQNPGLYSVLGKNFGGSGNVFMLPNLAGAAAMNWGTGKGLSPRTIGQTGGEPFVTLIMSELPAHTHPAQAADTGTASNPAGEVWAAAGQERPIPNFYSDNGSTTLAMANVIQPVGGNMYHNNLMPFQGVNFCIAMQDNLPDESNT